MKTPSLESFLVFIYTGKPELDALIAQQLEKGVTSKGLLSIVLKSGFTSDEEVIAGIANYFTRPDLIIIKLDRGGIRLKVFEAACEHSIIPLIWSRNVHFKESCLLHGAQFVPILEGKKSLDQTTRIVTMATFTIEKVLNMVPCVAL